MNVSAAGSRTTQPASPARTERTVLVMKQAQDAAKAQAEALLTLVTDAAAQIGRNIDVRA